MNSDNLYPQLNPSAPPIDSMGTTTVAPIISAPVIISGLPLQGDTSRFDLLVKQNELNPVVAEQLRDVLSTCEIVLLCDDSDSMSLPIAEEGTDPFAPKRSSRWLELKKLASVIIQFVTAINPTGLDLYFLNRPKVCNVSSSAGLQNIFNIPPHGGTNLTEALLQVYQEKKHVLSSKKLLIVTITDGEPVDGTDTARSNLFNAIDYIIENGKGNIHVSFAECTDNAEDMEYLDQWDGLIRNWDNSNDFREEVQRVKTIQGPQFKFTFVDYVIKILLATFVRWYFNLDQVKVTNSQQQSYQPSQNPQYSASIQQQYPNRQYIPAVQPQPQPQPQSQPQSQMQYSVQQYSAQQYQPQYTGPSLPPQPLSSPMASDKCCCLLL